MCVKGYIFYRLDSYLIDKMVAWLSENTGSSDRIHRASRSLPKNEPGILNFNNQPDSVASTRYPCKEIKANISTLASLKCAQSVGVRRTFTRAQDDASD